MGKDKGYGGEERRRHLQHHSEWGRDRKCEDEVSRSNAGLGRIEVNHRIGAASKVIGALREEVIEQRELNKSTKFRVINATVMPTLLYACETWTLLDRHKSKVQAFEMRCLRKWKE